MLESLVSSMGLVGVLIVCLLAMLILYVAAELVKRLGSKSSSGTAEVETKDHVSCTGKRVWGRTYYATFQFSDGNREELVLPGEDFGLLAEGDEGTLTRLGGRYVHFERDL